MLSNEPIANLTPHYTQPRFAEAQTVWVKDGHKPQGRYQTVKDADYNYSDRIWGWNWEKADQAHKVIDESLDRRSPAYIQEFLRFFFDNPTIELVHVMAGYNVATGYPYQVYGYFSKESAK
jgi:hypothetical protein